MGGTGEYFDDALSGDDEYILYGGHYSKVGHKTTILCWWPKVSIWAVPGLSLASILAIGLKYVAEDYVEGIWIPVYFRHRMTYIMYY
jgi:hypothetical protein